MLIFEKDFPKKLDYLKLWGLFCQMGKTINKFYIFDLFSDKNNKIALYSIDNSKFDLKNCPCGLVYRIEKNNISNTNDNPVFEINIYIMFIATEYRYRKTGYASLFINEFMSHIKDKYKGKYDKISIILDSIETAVTFYEHFGFKWTTTETKYDAVFHIDETNKNQHFVMVYNCQ